MLLIDFPSNDPFTTKSSKQNGQVPLPLWVVMQFSPQYAHSVTLHHITTHSITFYHITTHSITFHHIAATSNKIQYPKGSALMLLLA
jgi:hypothetical protein